MWLPLKKKMMEMIKVLLADDHIMVRAGIKHLLGEAEDIKVVSEASNGQEAIAVVKLDFPDVVILDISI